MAHFRSVLPGRVFDVSYERLVHDPEGVLKDIVERLLKLKWEPAVLTFHTQRRVVQTNSMTRKFIPEFFIYRYLLKCCLKRNSERNIQQFCRCLAQV